MSSSSYVVTGGGRAIVEGLVATGVTVAVVEFDEPALDWIGTHPAADRLLPIIGDAADEEVATRAAVSAAPRPHCEAGSTTRPCSGTPGCTRHRPARSST